MDIKHAENGTEFQNNSKKYVLNMTMNSRHTLHVKNGCHHAKFFYNYLDFDTLEEANSCGVDYLKCQLCFKEK